MVQKSLLSSELLEQYREGKRIFSDIILQFADLQALDISGITFKNSKLFFVSFFNTKLSSSRFINCEIFFLSFYGGNLENSKFEDCTIDLTLFDRSVFKNTKISRSKITWSGFFNTAIGELDMSSSTQFKVFTNYDQVTQKDADEAMTRLGPMIASFDISIRAKFKEVINKEVAGYGFNVDESNYTKPYEKPPLKYDSVGASTYGSMRGLLDELITAYNAQDTYMARKPHYSKDNAYK